MMSGSLTLGPSPRAARVAEPARGGVPRGDVPRDEAAATPAQAGPAPARLTLLHTVPYLVHEASGLTDAVVRLCDEQVRAGHRVELMSLAGSLRREWGAVRYRSFDAVPAFRRLGLSPALHRAIARSTPAADLVHVHSLWMLPSWYPVREARRRELPVVVSPHGTLAPGAMAISRLVKRVVWRLWQRRALQQAACLHATSETEYEHIRALGIGTPVAIVPLGIDSARRVTAPPSVDLAPGTRTALYIGRIHRQKRLDSLIRAWARVAPAHPHWRLCIVGTDTDGSRVELERLAESLRAPRLAFGGAVFGDDKERVFAQADLHVQPSPFENFGLTIAEALARALPVIATTGTPWSGLARHGCGWWVAPDEQALAGALDEAFALDAPRLRAMGAAGAAWMADEFTWTRAIVALDAVYRWVTGGGTAPPTVRLD